MPSRTSTVSSTAWTCLRTRSWTSQPGERRRKAWGPCAGPLRETADRSAVEVQSMSINYLKRATRTAESGQDEVRHAVQSMLERIERDGDAAALGFARDL